MSRPILLRGALLLTLTVALGCHPQQPFYFFEDGDLSHYIDKATEIEYPDAEVETLGEVDGALPPLTLENSDPKSIWDLPLEEAVRITLSNSKVVRSLDGNLANVSLTSRMPDFLTRSPDLATTIYDPAVTETNPRTGVEQALSAFDALFTTSVFWEKNDTPRNTFSFVDDPEDPGDISSAFPDILRQDVGNFEAALQKTSADGTTWSLSHGVAYDWENTTRQFPSDWNVNLEAEFRHPLLQGRGVQFNRIAGPGAIPGFNNGVMVARVNTDIALTDFEAEVRDLVNDVETAYWGLYLAYRELDAVIAGRDSALQTWRKIHSLYVVSARGGEAEKEAQAREQYFLFRSQVEQRLSNLYAAEANLRYIMGLAATDGRLIRPADEPTTAKVSFDWHAVTAEGLARNVSLRRQRWKVKRSEMELIAAKNYLLPRLDAVGRYRWLGLGDHLINPTPQAAFRDNAYQELTSGKYQEWHLGLDLSLPIGFRKEMSGVRHAQLNLARERTLLQEEELEVSHQLAHAIRNLDKGLVVTRTNFNRRVAAERQVEAVAAAYETETVTLDLLLDAQRRLAEAEIEYFRSLVDYNLAITQVHFRKGSLLEYNGVFLAEGPWTGKAYFDARRRARARDASLYLDYGFTRPKVISRGPIDQAAGRGEVLFAPESMMPGDAPLEAIPTPAPELEEIPAEPAPPAADEARTAPGPVLRPAKRKTISAAKPSSGVDTQLASLSTMTKNAAPKASSPVRQAAYEAPEPKSKNPKKTWTSKGSGIQKPSSKPEDTASTSTSAETARPTSGWKRVSR